MSTRAFSTHCHFHKPRWKCGVISKALISRSSPTSPCAASLEMIYYCLKKMNAGLWRELRRGTLAECYVGLYIVQLDNSARDREWRKVNRRTVSSLNSFATAETVKERHTYLQDALDRIGQKLLLVQLALKRKADTPTVEENYTIQSYKTALYRLSYLLGAFHESLETPGAA